MSELFQIFLHKLRIKPICCTAYHPQTNGVIEKSHRTLKSISKASLWNRRMVNGIGS
jgi:transposase